MRNRILFVVALSGCSLARHKVDDAPLPALAEEETSLVSYGDGGLAIGTVLDFVEGEETPTEKNLVIEGEVIHCKGNLYITPDGVMCEEVEVR